MSQCQGCGTQNLRGAIFCEQCGASLLPQDRRRDTTHTLGSRPGPPLRPAAPAAGEAAMPGERRLRATVINNGRRVSLPLDTPVLIGRQDSARGFFPDLDLSNDGGYDSGVSRRHARICVIDEAAYVEDLESANGSFVNDQRLPPRRPQHLRPGDELKLGSLILRIEQT
jgi:pSer/pThr/pTyr-binding forkhead associated (FHA) protein